MNAPSHPSYLALDRLAAGEPDSEVAAHLEVCARCRSHLDRLRVVPAVPRSALPQRRRRMWAVPLGAAAVAALVLLLVDLNQEPTRVRSPSSLEQARVQPEPDVRTKGPPRHVLWIKRGQRVFPWQPGVSLVPDDQLRLEVAGAGYRHLAVAASAGDRWQVLYRDALPSEGAVLLDAGWRVDASGDDEALLVVFSHEPVPQADLSGLASDPRRDDQLWTVRLDLPKEPR